MLMITQDPTALTPVEWRGPYLIKRDDLFQLYGVQGTKVRAALAILEGSEGIVGYGGRRSNTAAAMAAAGKRLLGKPVHFFTAAGPETPEMQLAARLGAMVVRCTPGYLSVQKARATTAAKGFGWPCGLRHRVAIKAIAKQVDNIVTIGKQPNRIVVASGATICLAGILSGLRTAHRQIPILGVCVGAPYDSSLLDDIDPNWRELVSFVASDLKYDQAPDVQEIYGLELDPIYEAKLIPFLREGDLIWNSGKRSV